MQNVNVHEAKTRLSQLLEAAAAGKEVVIAKAGKPVAKLVGVQTQRVRRKGLLKGRIRIGKAFDAPLPDEVVEAFEPRSAL